MPPVDDDDDAIEALRRSLYRPGTEADAAARYRQAVAEPEAPARSAQAPARAARGAGGHRPRRGRIAALALGTCAVVLLGILSSRLAAAPPVSSSSAAPSPTLTTPVGVRSETLGLDHQTRAAITTSLDSGSRAGLAFLFDFHPEQRPAALRTTSRYGLVELDGTGPGTMPISASGGVSTADGGRVTVLVVTTRDVLASWSLMGTSPRPSGPPSTAPILRLTGEHRPGEPVVASARYPAGGAPDALTVDVPTGVRWGAAVVFSR